MCGSMGKKKKMKYKDGGEVDVKGSYEKPAGQGQGAQVKSNKFSGCY